MGFWTPRRRSVTNRVHPVAMPEFVNQVMGHAAENPAVSITALEAAVKVQEPTRKLDRKNISDKNVFAIDQHQW